MFYIFKFELHSLISEYVYDKNKKCSGLQIGYKRSLHAAQIACKKDNECACIHDWYCNGGRWYMYTGQLTTNNFDFCSWTKTGSLI